MANRLSRLGTIRPIAAGRHARSCKVCASAQRGRHATESVVQGIPRDDQIIVAPGWAAGEVVAELNGLRLGTLAVSDRLVAHGSGGDDDIQVAGSIELKAWLYADDGHDRPKGGAGNDALFGGSGDDLLVGNNGRDLLVGGARPLHKIHVRLLNPACRLDLRVSWAAGLYGPTLGIRQFWTEIRTVGPRDGIEAHAHRIEQRFLP